MDMRVVCFLTVFFWLYIFPQNVSKYASDVELGNFLRYHSTSIYRLIVYSSLLIASIDSLQLPF